MPNEMPEAMIAPDHRIAAPAWRLPGDPVLSVVVTCYNYGHFLDRCLESLLAQTRPPDEIVVIDDGSTDATGEVLARAGAGIRTIRTPNHGQAAAFNTGFAATTGDAVLFLDADDLLHPEAVETLLAAWTPDLTVLTFVLETIDADGRSTGLHEGSRAASGGDHRPELLRTGTFLFPPTSGNLYSRAFLKAVLPMPEKRWRISADCFLIRAAALYGRAAHVDRVLGCYRVHGSNGHAQTYSDASDLSRAAANDRDIADALDELAQRAGLFAGRDGERAALRDLLSARAQTVRARVRPWPEVADTAPEPAEAAGLPDPAHGLLSPRWPGFVRPDDWIAFDGGPQAAAFITRRTASLTCGVVTTVDFETDPAPDMRQLTLELDWNGPAEGDGSELAVLVNDVLVWRCEGPVPVRVDLPVVAQPWADRPRLKIDLHHRSTAGSFVPEQQAQLRLRRLLISDVGARSAAFVETGAMVPFGDLLAATADAGAWEIAPDGCATLQSGEGNAAFVALHGGPCELVLTFRPQRRGAWLQVRHDGIPVFSGDIGCASVVSIALPAANSPSGERQISLAFTPPPAAGHDKLGVVSMGLRAREWAAPLNVGEKVVPAANAHGSRHLAAGWETDQDGGVRNGGPEAVIAFRLPDAAQDAKLVLDVEPLLSLAGVARHVLGVTRNGALLAAVQLDGPGRVEIPIPETDRGRVVELVIHSALLLEETDRAEDRPALAVFELRSLELTGQEAPGVAAPLPGVIRATAPPRHRALLDHARQILDAAGDGGQRGDLAAVRDEIAGFIATSAPTALLLICAAPDGLATLQRIGAATRHLPCAPHPAERRRVEPEDTGTLRAVLVAMLSVPAQDAPLGSDIAELPAPLFYRPEAFAAYLAILPDLPDAAAHERARRYLSALYSSLDLMIAREPPGSARFRLASATLMALRTTRAIFGSGALKDLVRMRSRCIERLLLQQGARLAMPRAPRDARRRLRIGVLARDVRAHPEGWALRGMYAGLDPERFEVTLVLMDQSDEAADAVALFDGVVCLSGLSVAASVDAIRARDFDVFVMGCYVSDWEKTSAIAAHRLAPVQLWHGAVCPTTGGFRSFDRVVSCRATEPARPERHYTEPVAWIDGPLQCAYDFPQVEPPDTASLRDEIGVPAGALMLVSGAMAHKIGDELMDIWADILQALPEAALVLYPFASNWSLAFEDEVFRARFDRSLAARSVDPARLILLPTQQPEDVRRIVAAADLYLDSLPCTGATTVCEALSMGTPVVTCEGDPLRERTGASWVRAYGLPDLVAGSPGAYRDLAVALGSDRPRLKACRDHIAATLKAAPPPHCDTAAFGAAYSATLWQIARDSGLFPHLESDAPAETPAAPRLRRPVTPLRKFAILTNPRSGSTFLCGLLNGTEGVLCHYELFHPEMIQFHDGHVHDPAEVSRRDKDPGAFLQRLGIEAEQQGYRALGFKHFYGFSADVAEIIAADRGMRVICLVRANLLAQYASDRLAHRTGEWIRDRGADREVARMHFDPADFESFETYHQARQGALVQLLARHGREAMWLEYKTLFDMTAPQRLSRFLGVTIQPDYDVASQRQNPAIPLDRFTNPGDVEAYLARRNLSHWARDA